MGTSENVTYDLSSLKVEELPEVKLFGELFTQSVEYPGGFNWESFSRAWSHLLQSNMGRIAVVKSKSGDLVVGVFGSVYCEDPFSGWMTAMEQFWFVLPEFRKSRAGAMLYEDFNLESVRRKCKKRIMVTLEGEFSDALSAWYIKDGYHLAEKSFVKIVS